MSRLIRFASCFLGAGIVLGAALIPGCGGASDSERPGTSTPTEQEKAELKAAGKSDPSQK